MFSVSAIMVYLGSLSFAFCFLTLFSPLLVAFVGCMVSWRDYAMVVMRLSSFLYCISLSIMVIFLAFSCSFAFASRAAYFLRASSVFWLMATNSFLLIIPAINLRLALLSTNGSWLGSICSICISSMTLESTVFVSFEAIWPARTLAAALSFRSSSINSTALPLLSKRNLELSSTFWRFYCILSIYS